MTGASIGIDVINGSDELHRPAATGSGSKLDGTEGANVNTGIFLDPGSDEATIGGGESRRAQCDRRNNDVGLDIEGASNAVIRGNYFGVAPDGTTQMANAKEHRDHRLDRRVAASQRSAMRSARRSKAPALTTRRLRRRLQRDLRRRTSTGDRPQRRGSPPERGAGQRSDHDPRQLRRPRRRREPRACECASGASMAGGADHVTVGGSRLGR